MKFLILGAGPAGLCIANLLKRKGENSFLILEKEEVAGGLCRSTIVDGFPLDIGGGHFLDTRRSEVNNFLFSFLTENEWNLFERNTKINLNNIQIDYPFESNIWQLDIEKQIEYLKSVAIAGSNLNVKKPKKFVEWIKWKLGNQIAKTYMLPYNQKLFGDNLNQLGTYWLEKLPNVSFEEILRSCLQKKAYGKTPAHANFYYPKRYGYGEVWNRMAASVERHIQYSTNVVALNFSEKNVIDQRGKKYSATYIISTIPWNSFKNFIGMPSLIQNSIKCLKHVPIRVDYYPINLETKAQWIYCPDQNLPYHRILVRHNFCNHSRGFWTETNGNKSLYLGNESEHFTYLNEYAYPLNTIKKPRIMANLLNWCRRNDVYAIGRWGEHEHYNSDVVVEKAIHFLNNFRLYLYGNLKQNK